MPTSSQIRSSLEASLIAQAVITQQEPVYAQVGALLDAALTEHAPDYLKDYAQLPLREYELVILLGWERVCLSRASFYAPQPSLNMKSGNPGFGSDRDTPFNKNTAFAKQLRQRYVELKGNLTANSHDRDDSNASGDIEVGELYRSDDTLNVKLPLRNAPVIQPVILQLQSQFAGGCVIRWSECADDDFLTAYVLHSTVSPINENWNSDGTNGIPFACADSNILFTTQDHVSRGLKVVELPAGTAYFCVVVKSRSGRYAFSNEVSVAITV